MLVLTPDSHPLTIHRHAVRLIPNIQYGDHPRQALDIYMPPDVTHSKVIFFVHGGSWSSGNRADYGHVGHFYAQKGFVVVVVDHRLSPEVKHPEHLNDVKTAFLWTRDNIYNYGGRYPLIHLFGHSSGAHLVSLLATKHKYGTIASVTAVSGIYSLGLNVILAGYSDVFPDSSQLAHASPYEFASSYIPFPFLILYADSDIVTFKNQAKNFHERLSKRKHYFRGSSKLHCIKGEDHRSILDACATPGKTSNIILDFMK
jgi:acetyl esterase/lipase